MHFDDKVIRAVYNEKTIRVYQAFNEVIADEALKNGTFGSHFSTSRMTWIKPSFLWMMHRSDWGRNLNQERILALDINRAYFDNAVKSAISTSYESYGEDDKFNRKMEVKMADILIQWDPEKDINGRNLPYKSLQLGLRRGALEAYINLWIEDITDITDYVRDLNKIRLSEGDLSDKLPHEKIYHLTRSESL